MFWDVIEKEHFQTSIQASLIWKFHPKMLVTLTNQDKSTPTLSENISLSFSRYT